jgi:hypothetical protein
MKIERQVTVIAEANIAAGEKRERKGGSEGGSNAVNEGKTLVNWKN